MERENAPYRADQVGSFLRSKPLKDARANRETGKINAAQLREIEDREITTLVRKQEDIGLHAVTDGEFRRAFWHFDFFERLNGIEGRWDDHSSIRFHGMQTRPRGMYVTGRISFPGDHPMIEHFKFLKKTARHQAKMTIPSPSMLYYRGGKSMFENNSYNDLSAYYADLGKTYADTVAAFADAGCTYLQLDDVSFAYLCDTQQRKMLEDRGDDPGEQMTRNIEMINAGIANRSKDMCITMHLCRGNFRSTFIASGGYEPVADALFNCVDADGYFMEWDTERAGGFEPLRFLPKGKIAVLGLVTTKTGTIENKDDLKRRIDDAAKFAPLEQLALSPQCGFASTEEGNVIAGDEQWRKLELVAETAREIWG